MAFGKIHARSAGDIQIDTEKIIPLFCKKTVPPDEKMLFLEFLYCDKNDTRKDSDGNYEKNIPLLL